MPVGQSAQSVLLDEKRIASRPVLYRVRCHSTSKKSLQRSKNDYKEGVHKKYSYFGGYFQENCLGAERVAKK